MQLNAMTTWRGWRVGADRPVLTDWEKDLLAKANQLSLGNESNLGPHCALLE